MMRIEKLFEGREFQVTCVEHRATFRCTADELSLVSKRVFAYNCPVCGKIHTVPAYRVQEMEVSRLDVELNDPNLPINIEKAEKEAAKAKENAIQKQIMKLEKALEKTTDNAAKIFGDTLEKVNKEIEEKKQNEGDITK